MWASDLGFLDKFPGGMTNFKDLYNSVENLLPLTNENEVPIIIKLTDGEDSCGTSK
jgi:hypothetical protein